MPNHIITPAASELIRTEKAAGKSSRDIAKILADRLGIEIDQRTVSRHMQKLAPVLGAKPRSVEVAPAAPREPAEVDSIDEIEALERQVVTLLGLLEGDIPNRDRVAINAELRQTYGSIRKAKSARREEAAIQSADAAWVLAKLKRFDAMAGEGAEQDDEDAVPATTGTAAEG